MKLSDRIRIAIPAACLILASLCSGGEMTPAQRENYIERLNAGHWKLELAMRSGNPSHVTLAQQASQQTASELPPGPEDGGDVESQFSRFYQQKVWGNDGGGSGVGSSPTSTINAIAVIRLVVNKYRLRSLLDAPCGAMGWQPTLLESLQDDIPDFRYFGVDVVPSVIQANQQMFANHQNWQFEKVNLATDALPQGYDLILSRDALQHLPCELGVDALQNLAKAGSRYLLLGSYEHEAQNRRIKVGDYYSINLRLPPFSLSDGVVHAFNEHTATQWGRGEPDKYLLLFPGDFLRSRDFKAMRAGCRKL